MLWEIRRAFSVERRNGYQQTQFYEYFRRFTKENYSSRDTYMPVERLPGEKLYIDIVFMRLYRLLQCSVNFNLQI